ncbi:MAG TPA: amino acid adenylation domain-containing protein [Clostridia bacterium]|nr:amino acid adenylation domain-containing protein [Clostridia bacterium]
MLIKAFNERVKKSGNKIAVKTNDGFLTFNELDIRVQKLAKQIKAEIRDLRHISKAPVIALLFEHGTDMIVSSLGALKARSIYVPFDPSYPESRLLYMLMDSEASLIVTNEKNYALAVRLVSQADNRLNILNISNSNLTEPEIDVPEEEHDGAAYILYTSGSTGKPKGVVQTQSNILHFAKSYINTLGLTEADRLTLFSVFSHDAAIIDIYSGVLSGASLYPYNMKEQDNISRLPEWLLREGITIWHSVPTLYRYFLNTLLGTEVFPKLRFAVLGGENVLEHDVIKHRDLLRNVTLMNLYGQSESSYNSSQLIRRSDEFAGINIGEAVPETQVIVLNEKDKKVPVLRLGEIVIASNHLALGYWKQEEKTKAVFVNHPEFGRIYRTGDLGWVNLNGDIEYRGRKDFQMKIRGYRIEPEEIENCLLKYEMLREAAVIGKSNGDSELSLYAYVTADKTVEGVELRTFLAKELPEYMIPAHFIQLEKMPLTPTNKIDRLALQEMESITAQTTEYEAARNEMEETLVSIWQEVLKLDRIGINDNFFDLGGHSLKATTLVSQVHKAFNVELPLREVFKAPTIKGLSEYIKSLEEHKYTFIEPVDESAYYELSSAQKRLYTLQQLEPEGIGYNMPKVLLIEGKLDIKKLEEAFKRLIQRHETFRTGFELVGEEILQKVYNEVTFEVEYLDNMLSKEDAEEIVKGFIRPFDLSKVPLLRVKLAKIQPQQDMLRYILMYDMHHIISDGTSTGILAEEFMKLYEGKELPELRIQYKDYAAWQNKLVKAEIMQQQENYWLKTFEGELPVLNLPTDYPRPAIQSLEGAEYVFSIKGSLYSRLKELAKQSSTTLFMVLLGLFSVELSKYSGQEDMVIGTVTAGRTDSDLQSLIGLFLNNIAFRCMPGKKKTFIEYLNELKSEVLNAYENQNYPIEELIRRLDIRKDISRNALFDVMIILQNFDQNGIEIAASSLNMSPYPMAQNTSDYDMSLYVYETSEELRLKLQYSTKLFKAETIRDFAKHFINLSNELLQEPEKQLGQVEMTDEEERHKLLREFNGVGADYPGDKTIQELFEAQVERTPDNIAAVYNGKSSEGKVLTYTELNERANQLARRLRSKGVRADQIVGIMAERSLEMLIGIMGILKAGGAYLPIDPVYPEERINFMMEDSGTDLLLTQKHLKGKVRFQGEIINLEDPDLYEGDSSNLNVGYNLNDLIYVIYTSGTTGKPKGILTEHRNVIAYVNTFNEMFSIEEKDATLQQASMTFDGFVEEVYTILIKGGKVIIPENEEVKDAKALRELIVKNKVTILSCSPLIMSEFNKLKPMNSVHTFLSSSDVLKKEYTNNIIQYAKIFNMYGPSEATVCATCYSYSGAETGSIPIGRPLKHTRIYILDNNNNAQAVGIAGEICIAGEGVARGYLNRPELTAEKFVENLFELGTRMYRTGDLAKWLPDGNIEFLGRMDHQIKIRGYRIELGEIENRLLSHEEIKEAVVIAKDEEGGSKYLCAYLAGDRRMAISELREYMGKELPDYMIPSYFVQLDKMPMNSNGKVDRKALPEPGGNIHTGAEYEAARNEVEEKLVELWKDVLKADQIGINDNFFDLGGHSLKATSLVARMHKELNVEVPLREMFKTPTIKGLSEYIKGLKENIYASIEPVDESEYYELTSGQKRLYTLQQFEMEGIGYNMPGSLIIEGKLDVLRLKEAFNQLVQRHEALRTSFMMDGENILQKVHKEVPFEIEYFDKVSSEKEVKVALKRFVRTFDLSKAPLLRVGLIALSFGSIVQKERHLLMYDMHHIISDGTSMGILVEEFVELYEGKELPKLRVQYKDYAAWQNKLLSSEEMKQQEAYWLKEFDGEIPVLNLPTDYPRPVIKSFEGNRIYFELDEKITEALRKAVKETGTTMYMLLLASVNVLFSKYSGQEDIIIGSAIAGRPHADLENIIGMFVNTLAMRNYPEGTKTFRAFLEEVKRNALRAYENQDYQFDTLIEKLNVKRDMSRNPLFDVMLILQNMKMEGAEVEGLSFLPYSGENNIAKLDITIEAVEIGEKISLSIEYCTKLFHKDTIERMAGHLKKILSKTIENIDIALCEIDILTGEEKQKLLHEFNNTYAEYLGDKTVHELFEAQAAKTPDNIAVVYGDKQLSYGALNEKANQLASVLRAKGVGPDSIVGIMVERSLEMIIGIMGILKAGGAYLPIDPEYPKDRVVYMLEDSGTEVLLTKSGIAKTFEFNKHSLMLDEDRLYEGDANNLQKNNRSDDLAYVIYTSGSTGKPKGVMIEHKSIVNFIKGMTQEIEFREEESILALTTISFDIFGLETLLPLTRGMKIIIAEESSQKDPKALIRLINNHSIDILQITPSRMEMLLDSTTDNMGLTNLKEIIVGGEIFPKPLLEKLSARTNAKIYNAYGPTETTIWSTTKALYPDNVLNIGKPIANTRIYILDKNNKVQPVGVAGELCIGGDGLARGYLNRPELTAEKFVPNPYEPGEKMYCTGDLARWLADGNIEFLGRMDHQVKIRGFRIELGEIENRLLTYEGVKEAVVVAKGDESGNKYLSAYLVSEKEHTVAKLREHLNKELPTYMIPAYFIQLDKMPMTPNGKVDRKTLADSSKLEESDGGINTGALYVGPRNYLEEKLVEVWEKVLKLNKISIKDDFFEIGGNSINILQVINLISNEMDIELRMADLFINKTIEELSEYIKEEKAGDNLKSVQKINKNKNGKIIFILHGLNGSIYSYKDLAKLLENDFQIYGIQAKGLDGSCSLAKSIDEMVMDYVEEIKQVQSEDPYIIVGYCMGNILGYEIIRELEAQNKKVERYINIDEFAFLSHSIIWISKAQRIWDSLSKHNKLEKTLEDVAIAADKTVLEGQRELVGDKDKITKYMKNVINTTYRPKGMIKAQTYIIKAKETEHPKLNEKDWRKIVKNDVKMVEISGTHESILLHPHVEQLAEEIKNALKDL